MPQREPVKVGDTYIDDRGVTLTVHHRIEPEDSTFEYVANVTLTGPARQRILDRRTHYVLTETETGKQRTVSQKALYGPRYTEAEQ